LYRRYMLSVLLVMVDALCMIDFYSSDLMWLASVYIEYSVFGFRLHALGIVSFFFFNETATTEIYTLHIVGSVRCV